jgi:hypothetical protein
MLIIIISIIFLICLLLYLVLSNTNTVKEKMISKKQVKLKDEFVTIFSNNIFNFDKTIDQHAVISYPNNIYIGFVTCYHNSNPQKTILNLRSLYKNIYIIILDGEPMNLTHTTPDMIISTKYDSNNFPPNIPVIMVPYFSYTFNQNLNLKDLKSLIKTKSSQIPKTEFCVFIQSNCDEKQFPGVKMRGDFFKLLNKRSGNRVHSGGKCYNNIILEGKEKDNKNIYKRYKFVIAFENNDTYNSEKIIYPILANCIPIYFGSLHYKKYFNKNRIIDVQDFPNFDACIDRILEIDKNDDLFNMIINQPFLNNNTIDKNIFSFALGKGECYQRIYSALPLYLKPFVNFNTLYEKQIHLITFADGHNYKTDRLLREAYDSNYFDHVVDMSDKLNSFLYKHNNFIKENKRGYGYWIWKHRAIIDQYTKLNDNDILIYCDSGNSIIKHNMDFLKYIHTLINGTGIILFSLKHKERHWSKMDAIKTILNTSQIENILNSNQTTGALMMFRKCPNATRYLQEVASYSENYHMLNDDPSVQPNIPEFREHRHDQSIFSLVKHNHRFDLSYDNFDDDPKNIYKDNGDKKCFVVSRKRR